MHDLIVKNEMGFRPSEVKLHEPDDLNVAVVSSSKNTNNGGQRIRSYHLFADRDDSNNSDSESVNKSEGNISECSNPYLEKLLDRYFPSDEEDLGCEADGEYEITEIINNRKRVQLRHKSPLTRMTRSIRGGVSPMQGTGRKDTNRFCRGWLNGNKKKKESVVDLTEEETKHQHQCPDNDNCLDRDEWFEEARRQYVVREVERQQVTKNRMGDEWDINVSPDSVLGERKTETSDFMAPHLSTDEEGSEDEYKFVSSRERPEDTVRKSLFTSITGSRIMGVMSLRDTLVDEKSEEDVENEDDLEITYRARQIQHELRLQEMKELAIEAERAAEEGKEKFVGNATRFGLDDTISNVLPTLDSPRRNVISKEKNWASCGKLMSQCETDYYDTHIASPKLSTITYNFTLQSRAVTRKAIKRPRSLNMKDRYPSAPSKLQNRNPSPGIVDVPSSASSIFTTKSFLSITQSKAADKKIPVLSLRHIEEVIPSFREMQLFLKSQMTRVGVDEEMLRSINDIRQNGQTKNVKNKVNEKENGSSSSLFPRIQSFQKLFHSLSGLSLDESAQTKSNNGISESDNDIGPLSETEKNTVSLERTDIDRTSMSTHGEKSTISEADYQHSKQKKIPSQKKSFLNLDTEANSDQDDLMLMSSSDQSEIYVCTLASEINSPNRRPRSPPIQPPYLDMEGNMMAIIDKQSNITKPRPSRWKAFWANISPTRNLVSPIPRRSTSLPFEPHQEVRDAVRPQLARYHSQMTLQHEGIIQSPFTAPRPFSSDQLLHSEAKNDEIEHSNFFLRTSDDQFISRQNGKTIHVSNSNCMLKEEMLKRESNRSAKTEITQGSSYETGSSESAFSRYSAKQSKAVDSITQKDFDIGCSSMHEKKKDDDPLTNDWHYRINKQQTLPPGPDSACSPKPPLHPAGVRLANALLSNTAVRKGIEGNDLAVKKQEEIKSSQIAGDRPHYSSNLKMNPKSEIDSFSHLHSDKPSPLQNNVNRKRCLNTDKDNHDDNDNCENSILNSRDEIKRENSFSSIHSCCLAEDSSLCLDEASAHGFGLHALSSDNQPHTISGEEKNISSSTFLDIMENVKVPSSKSVMDRLSPLLGRNDSAYQDDVVFVGNYFYVGVGPKIDDSIKGQEAFNKYSDKPLCERESCVDVICKDFGSSIINQTFNLLSQKSSWDKESGPLLNEPQPYHTQPWLRKALSQCAGHPYHERRKEVVIGDKHFRAPSLRIQKGGFFSSRDEDIIHTPFEVDNNSHASDGLLCTGIEIGPVMEGNNTSSTDYIGISLMEDDHQDDDIYKLAAQYRNRMKIKPASCRSLLTFSDHSESDS